MSCKAHDRRLRETEVRACLLVGSNASTWISIQGSGLPSLYPVTISLGGPCYRPEASS